MPGEPEFRAAGPEDTEGIHDLLAVTLGKQLDDRYRRFLAWKHAENPFGPSPAWVACLDGDVVGYRTFLRWRLLDATGAVVPAVRAVDTATHPRVQGRGIFRSLTLAAVEDLTAEGVAFVFNTPNDQSRPGYLKMGWRSAGSLPAAFRPSGPLGLLRALRSRVPAALWSEPTDAGVPALDVLTDDRALSERLDPADSVGLRTDRDIEFLRWRYGNPDLRYRAVTDGSDAANGVAFFRLRRRGASREVVVCDVLSPHENVARTLLELIRRETRADHLVRLCLEGLPRAGYVRLPGGGPELTWRPLACDGTKEPSWQLSMGDIELF